MASLLDRMNITTGPVRRAKSASNRTTPYSRPPNKGDVDGQWSHDLFDNHNDLQSRISGSGKKPPFPAIAQRAFSDVFGQKKSTELSINGASNAHKNANAIKISGLTPGTTPEDVKTIFQRCGTITEARRDSDTTSDNVVIRITYKDPSHAATAVQKFNGQHADGRVLSVTVVGQRAAPNLAGRMGGSDGLDLVRSEGNLDILMTSGEDSGSKMRSDILAKGDPRAHVMVAPPGANPSEYLPQPARSGRGRGRGRGGRGNESWRGGRGRRGGRGDLSSRMDLS